MAYLECFVSYLPACEEVKRVMLSFLKSKTGKKVGWSHLSFLRRKGECHTSDYRFIEI